MTKRLGADQDITDVEGEVFEGAAEDISEMQDDIDSELKGILSEFGGDKQDAEFKIRVKQVVQNTGDTAHCFNAVPSELPLTDRITQEYGPGLYEIWVYRNGTRFRKRKLRIAEKMEQPVSKLIAENKQDLGALVSTMMEQNRKTMEQMQVMLTRQAAPAPTTDPVAMMTAMMGAMMQMKDFMQPAQSTDNMAMFVKGIEIAKDFAGGGAETNFNDTVIKLGKELLPSLINIAQTEQRGKVNAQLQRPVQPGQAGQPQPQLTGEQPVAESPDQNAAAFKMQIDMLVTQAAARKDVGIYADLIADNVPAEQIQAFITRPDMIEYLAQFNPQVPQYRQWFETLRSDLQEILTADAPTLDKDAIEKDLTDDPEGVIYPENKEPQSGVETVIEPDAVTLNSEST